MIDDQDQEKEKRQTRKAHIADLWQKESGILSGSLTLTGELVIGSRKARLVAFPIREEERRNHGPTHRLHVEEEV